MITASNREKTVHTVRFIEKLKSSYPLYYTYGNHEQKIILKEEYKKTAERFEKERTEAGISFLTTATAHLRTGGFPFTDWYWTILISKDSIPRRCPKAIWIPCLADPQKILTIF